MTNYYVIKKVGFFRRLFHLILTLVFKREVTVFTRARNIRPHGTAHDNWLRPQFLCPGCRKYQDWDFGAADDWPEMCDDCWDEKRNNSLDFAKEIEERKIG